MAAILYIEDEKIRRHSEKGGPNGEIAYAEYAAMLSLQVAEISSLGSPTLEAVERMIAEIAALFNGATSYYYSTQTDPAAPLEEKLQARLRTAGLLIRNPGNPDHWVSLLKHFSVHFDPKVEDALGVSVGDMIRIAESFVEIVNEKYNRFQSSLEERKDYTKLQQTPIPAPPSTNSNTDIAMLESGAWLEERNQLSTILVFDSAEISQRGAFTARQVEDFASIFSISHKEVDLKHTLLPNPLSPITRTPLVRDMSGIYCPNPVLLIWAILPRIAAVLNPANKHSAANKNIYHRFQSRLARFVEDTTASILLEVGGTRIETNLTYPLADAVGRTEVDVVGIIDRTLIIAECKAIFLDDATVRGGIESMKRHLRDTLATAQRQGERAIAAASIGDLRSSEDTNAYNYQHEIDYSILLLVVLDNYPVISSASIDIAETGYLGARPGVPITLLDLYEVSAYLREPWLWRNYFKQRASAIAKSYKTMALDETDYLALYVLSGRIGGDTTLFVAAAEAVLRDQYREANGDAFKFMNLGTSSKQLILALGQTQPARWTDAIDVVIEHRAEFEKRLTSQLFEVRQKKMARGIVLCAEGDAGFAVIPYKGVPEAMLRENVPIRLRELVPSVKEWLIVYWNLPKRTTAVSFLSDQPV